MTEPGPAPDLPEGWWAPALALAERPARPEQPAQPTHDRVVAWRVGFGDRFDARLAADHLTEQALDGLFSESPQELASRVRRPGWVDVVERAVAAARVRRVDTDDWRAAFAAPVRPFVTVAAAELTGRIASSADRVDVPAVVAAFAIRLTHQLVGVATRTLVHEHNTRRAAGRTTGIADFAAQLTEPTQLASLCATYPVLARLLGQASTCQTDAMAELLDRFAADRPAIVADLLDGRDPGQVTDIRAGLGEHHRRGRSVAVLSFADGRRVVYKPRDLGAHEAFRAAVRWLNTAAPGLDLRTVAAIHGSGYGWLEFVAPRPLPDHAAADRFYRRHGALLALLHALHAADMHFENVIACGDQPVLVDTETLFHPSLTTPTDAPDPAARTLSDSVHRTGLLPIMAVGEGGAADISGLGGAAAVDVVTDWAPDEHGVLRQLRRTVRRSASNLPTSADAGREVDVTDHETALLTGFRQAYDAIVRHRAAFTDLLTGNADVEVRVVARNSKGYATLLTESTKPDLMRDALRRDQAFDVLWTASSQHPLRWRACPHEQADLWASDVPMFTARAGSPDLYGSAGDRLPGVLDRTGLASALAKVAAMSEVDRRDQEWIISAALATRAPAGDHRTAPPVPGHLTGTAAPPERLLIAACTIADQVVARHLATAGHPRANWLGLELVDESQWLVLPMGASLGSGHLGVALFLAQVSELSGVTRYAAMARRALLGLPRLFDLLSSRPDLVAAIGCGGFTGFGGIAYALARLTTLLPKGEQDWDLAAATATAVDLAEAAARTTDEPGVASGLAGCLAAMTAVHAELGLPKAARLADECAARLAAHRFDAEDVEADRPRPSGFLDGAAGIAWALAGHDPEAATRAAAHAHARPGDVGWCTGAAGLAMAGAGDLDALLADRPVSRDLSLCHGELGITEALTVLATGKPAEPVAAARRGRTSLVLDAFTQYGATCGTPNGVTTPGLLTGLAGIGLGLLRLGYADRVPSVLLLAPSASTHEERTMDRCLTNGTTPTPRTPTTRAVGTASRGSSDSGRPRWPASSSPPAP